ncbi:hypothetical protein NCAS_0A10010 [Naumovozyma castellii]|uniref:RRM domain-containing protein n=1 Tax=Naumovozyma castellii TaxID=27288 RepID=G0V7W1_NAUCA|nr:hypothetical protein NCAS_0A10010 [Naumovozyma castellii CBS 4309]CCC67559.1 hypothetical protein NCAS_0A10010 [Naumovozyma castellii CBS 4309]
MSSEEEDFNDIYGEEQPTNPSTSKEVKDGEKSENKDTKGDSNLEEKSEEKDSKKEDATEKKVEDASSSESKPADSTSHLDQLAALQALSSNISQLAQQSTKPKEAADSASPAPVVNTAAPTTQPPPWEQLQQTVSQFQQPGQQQPPQMPPMGYPPQNNNSPYPSNIPANAPYQQQTSQQSPPPQKADLSKECCKLFIGGLNWETTEDKLKDYFSKYGNVVDLKIMKDNATGRSRGFGFLTFELSSSVDEVVKTQHILDGKVIDPKRAIPREEQDKTGKIFVGGIGPDVRPKEFEEFFAQWGTIIDAQLMLDKDTGRSRGFGFITYDSSEAVDRVCQNKYIDFKGKQIEIKRAAPRHMQKGANNGRNPRQFQNQMQAPPQMFQNQMMAAATSGMNQMYDPQAMNDYYQKMQAYYQQVQQQTGMDYSQMYQQQQQQQQQQPPVPMPMPVPAPYNVPAGGSPPTATSSDSATPTDNDDDNGRGSYRGYRSRTYNKRGNGNNNGYHPYNR